MVGAGAARASTPPSTAAPRRPAARRRADGRRAVAQRAASSSPIVPSDQEGDGLLGEEAPRHHRAARAAGRQRPRDSGPLDVVVKSDGFVTVQTRAYTFADSKVAVKLTKLEEKNTLLGYREELPAGRRRAARAVPTAGCRSEGAALRPRRQTHSNARNSALSV